MIFSFYDNKNDYNSRIIKIFLFFFFLAFNFTINALFFNDDTMHKIYMDKGSFNFIYQIPQILYSTLISVVINGLIKYLSLSQKDIIELKKEKNNQQISVKVQSLIIKLKIKFTLFFSVSLFILIFLAYYTICFCGIYVNTQIHLIKDNTLISFGLSLLYPLGIYLFPGIFRIHALNNKKKNSTYTYKFSKFLQIF